MKKFFLVALVLGFTQPAFANDLGRQVNIFSDNAGPRFSTVFAYDTDTVWTMTLSLWGRDLAPDMSMKSLAWRLLDSRTGQFINQWTTTVNNPSPVMYPGTIAFSWDLRQARNEVMAAIHALPNLKVLLSVNGDLAAPTATHFIDLGAYCSSNPGNFINLTTGGSGCSAN